jgi:hypothetical protein|tara:strand:- start:417 stop:713 length:297 start_codon:yes stop_codon:yes gene_type:complete
MRKPRDYKAEYAKYQGTAEQKKNRAVRNAARNTLTAKGVVAKGDGKHVNHKTPISRGGGNAPSNLSVKTEANNSSFPRTKKGAMKMAKKGGKITGRKK